MTFPKDEAKRYLRIFGGRLDPDYVKPLQPNEKWEGYHRVECRLWNSDTQKSDPVTPPHNVRHRDCNATRPCGCFSTWQRNADGAQTTGWKTYTRCDHHEKEIQRVIRGKH